MDHVITYQLEGEINLRLVSVTMAKMAQRSGMKLDGKISAVPVDGGYFYSASARYGVAEKSG